MSESVSPPPYHQEVARTSVTKKSDSIWQAWYRQLIALNFSQDEAVEYAKLFVDNDIEIQMIPELNDGVLKTIGIEKAGHRLRILRLQNQNFIQTPVLAPAVNILQPGANIARCAWHPYIAASAQCYNCKRLVCLNCRRVRTTGHHVLYYCQQCCEECVIQ